MDDTGRGAEAGTAVEASDKMKTTIGIISLAIAAILLVAVMDRVFSASLISLTRRQASAKITRLQESRGKNGTSYWMSYSFELDGKRYERRSLFGLLKQGTRISRNDAGSSAVGSKIVIEYSSLVPGVNESLLDPFKYDKMLFEMVGIVVFALLGKAQLASKASSEKKAG
jgi:hypothetical protein